MKFLRNILLAIATIFTVSHCQTPIENIPTNMIAQRYT